MGNEENFGILKQRPQNPFMSSYIFGKNVSVFRKTSVGSDIHNGNLWISNTWVKKTFLSMSYPNIMLLYFEKNKM